jgi:uncharacterized protein
VSLLPTVIALLSPAKRLDFGADCPFPASVAPLLRETKQLSRFTRELSARDLARLMKLSPSLAQLNAERFAAFEATPSPKNARPAVWVFAGDTYVGLRAREFDAKQMEYAQSHIGILSGLYGVLRPLDAILPYRLEMGTQLATDRGSSLYEFWGDRIARQINRLAKDASARLIVNLASQEYFQAVDGSALTTKVITPVFKEKRGNQLKVVGIMAKRARGAMARYVVETRAKKAEQLKDFSSLGYRYQPSLSDASSLVFVRAAG